MNIVGMIGLAFYRALVIAMLIGIWQHFYPLAELNAWEIGLIILMVSLSSFANFKNEKP